ncbi:MAG: LacI family DNA-binding transcriptional regulator [Silicimonas sp.]|nr:LacI family DNA-binding transcriptional regulator [Silicimonas sp.]
MHFRKGLHIPVTDLYLTRSNTGQARRVKKNVTLKDIARETGVHVSTVSRALTPNARASLSTEIVSKIRETAERLGYRPNRLASGLRTNRTMSVGVMIPDITNSLFPPIVRGIESVLEPAGYTSIVVNTDSDADREARLYDVLRERGVDGIINAAVHRIDPAALQVFDEIPVVTINRRVESASLPAVISDDAGGIRMAVDHLMENGHKVIAHIAGPETLSTGVDRRKAFEAAMEAHGVKASEYHVAKAAHYIEDEGVRCTEDLLDADASITALVCANDRLALGALDAISRRGLRCPDDMSITGFNDIPFLDLIPPGLTTVQVLQFEVGSTAAEILLKMMAGPDSRVPTTTILPVSLIERGSVQKPKRRSKTRKSRRA